MCQRYITFFVPPPLPVMLTHFLNAPMAHSCFAHTLGNAMCLACHLARFASFHLHLRAKMPKFCTHVLLRSLSVSLGRFAKLSQECSGKSGFFKAMMVRIYIAATFVLLGMMYSTVTSVQFALLPGVIYWLTLNVLSAPNPFCITSIWLLKYETIWFRAQS